MDKNLLRQVVSLTDGLYWQNGIPPTPDRLYEPFKDRCTRSQFNSVINSKDYRAQIEQRGIPLPNPPKDALPADILTPRQSLAISIMLNPSDHRSDRSKIETLNETLSLADPPLKKVTLTEWNGWRRQPGFREHLRHRSRGLFESSEHVFWQSLEQQVSNGDSTAMKLYSQITGIFDPNKVTVSIELDGVVSALFEVLARHVSPEILTTIADELDQKLQLRTALETRETQPSAAVGSVGSQAPLVLEL